MSTLDFIHNVMSGNAVDAQSALNDVLSSKAFEALQHRKVDLAQNLFTTADMNEEVEQIDEISQALKDRYINKASKEHAKNIDREERAFRRGDYAKATHYDDKIARREYGLSLAMQDKTKTKNEAVELIDEDIYTHIKLGKKVKNPDGGHDQTVHYKGKKIGHIGSYEHHSGTKYYADHHESGSDITGSRSEKEALGDLRALHADHLRPFKD